MILEPAEVHSCVVFLPRCIQNPETRMRIPSSRISRFGRPYESQTAWPGPAPERCCPPFLSPCSFYCQQRYESDSLWIDQWYRQKACRAFYDVNRRRKKSNLEATRLSKYCAESVRFCVRLSKRRLWKKGIIWKIMQNLESNKPKKNNNFQ